MGRNEGEGRPSIGRRELNKLGEVLGARFVTKNARHLKRETRKSSSVSKGVGGGRGVRGVWGPGHPKG